jgi:hypothetical protein
MENKLEEALSTLEKELVAVFGTPMPKDKQ